MAKQLVLMVLTTIFSTGCIVGDVVALPFRVTGAVVNTIAPDVVGDSISNTGELLDTIIPF
jgi:hypothetical protein